MPERANAIQSREHFGIVGIGSLESLEICLGGVVATRPDQDIGQPDSAVVVVGPLIEVPVLVALVYVSLALRKRFTPTSR